MELILSYLGQGQFCIGESGCLAFAQNLGKGRLDHAYLHLSDRVVTAELTLSSGKQVLTGDTY